MNRDVQLELAELLKTRKIEVVAADTNGHVLLACTDGHVITIKDAHINKPRKASAEHLTDPFGMPKPEDNPSTPACLGSGNTCSPDAEEMFPGAGV